jgi:hypothetical protein
VLSERFDVLDSSEFAEYSFPNEFIELNAEWSHHEQVFSEAAKKGREGFQIAQPEDGLVYIAHSFDYPFDEASRALEEYVRGWEVVFSSLRHRVNGCAHHLPPIVLLDIPADLVASYLDFDYDFMVLVDQRRVRKLLTHLLPTWQCIAGSSGPSSLRMHPEAGPDVDVGPTALENVHYGLATIDSATTRIAQGLLSVGIV